MNKNNKLTDSKIQNKKVPTQKFISQGSINESFTLRMKTLLMLQSSQLFSVSISTSL